MFRPFLLMVSALLALFSSTYAQTDPLRTKLDNVFSAINKTLVPTGFLEEFGAPFIPLDVFNGVLTDSNKVNIEAWRMAYATLYTSRISGTNPLPTLPTVNTSIETEENAGASIPVPIFYGNYSYLRPDALTANLLTLSAEKYYDVSGRPMVPYTTRQLFVASPSRNYTRDGSISLVFKSGLYYSNSGKTVSSFQVDFHS